MQRHVLYLAIVAAAISVVSIPAEPELKQPNWSKGWSYHPTNPNWSEHRLTVNSAARNGDELYGDLMFTNVVDGKKIPPSITIRGAQLPDGSFWPYASLEVGSDFKGPWKAIGSSHRNGKEISVTVPASITVAGLKADFRPFRPFFDNMAWGRIVLPTGDVAVIQLKELRD